MKKGFKQSKRPLIYAMIILIGVCVISYQSVLIGTHSLIDYIEIYPIKKINISGSIAPKTRKKLLKDYRLQKIIDQKRSLLVIDTKKLEEELTKMIEIKEVKIKRSFPNTLDLFVEENLDIIIVKTPRNEYAVNLEGKTIDLPSLNYNRFIVQLQEQNIAEKELTENFFGRFLKEIRSLPKEERDFLSLFSHLDYQRGRIYLYTNAHPVTITWIDKSPTKFARKARYALLYWRQKNLAHQGFNLIDISGKLIRYSSRSKNEF